MSLIKNAEDITGADWSLLFDAGADGGPVRAISIENIAGGDGDAEVLVAPINTLNTETPAGGAEGVVLALGAIKEFVGSVNGNPSILKAWIRPVNPAHTVSVNSSVTAR